MRKPFLLLLILTIFLISCLSNTQKESVDKLSICEQIQDGNLKNSCYHKIAGATQDVSICNLFKNKDACFFIIGTKKRDSYYCELIQNEDTKFSCYSDLNKIDLELCKKLKDSRLSKHCHDEYYIHQATKLENESLCNKIEDEYIQNRCIINISVSKKDSSLCKNIQTLNRNLCIQKVNAVLSMENLQLCEKFNFSFCFKNFAVKNQDESLCNKISDKIGRDTCLEEVAIAKKDIALCRKIEDISYQNSCIGRIGEILKDTSICAIVNKKSLAKDNCYKSIALETLNESLCNSIEILPKSICFEEIAIMKLDENICDKASPVSGCLREVGIAKKDFKICDSIVGNEYKAFCYQGVALQLNDSSLCLPINKLDIKDFCYRELAVKNRDQKLCDQISNQTTKDYCFSSIAYEYYINS